MTDAPNIEANSRQGWQAGDEACKLAYELVSAGVSWLEACETAGVTYTTAQMRYRFRGLPSPCRVQVAPPGGRDAASQRAYDRAVGGEVARTVSAEEGISYQYLRRWCQRNGKPAPTTTLRAIKTEIAEIYGTK